MKPSQRIRAGDIVEVNRDGWVRQMKVVTPIKQRVGAKPAENCFKELGPKVGPKNRVRQIEEGIAFRDQGDGRPTKRDRREGERKVNFGQQTADYGMADLLLVPSGQTENIEKVYSYMNTDGIEKSICPEA